MLKITGLSAGYAGLAVLKDVSIHIHPGEFAAIVGPNGAGKTTLFKTISGTVTAMQGSIEFNGQDLLAIKPHDRAHLGIAHIPEGRQVFPSLSILENLEMGAYTQAGKIAWKDNLEKIFTWFPVLAERQTSAAGALSGGQQQMLAIARGIASAPKLLMFDEPSMGLSPVIADEIFERIVTIHRDMGLTILLVEQRVAEALHYADRGFVLESGRMVLEGSPQALKSNDRVRRAYLGM